MRCFINKTIQLIITDLCEKMLKCALLKMPPPEDNWFLSVRPHPVKLTYKLYKAWSCKDHIWSHFGHITHKFSFVGVFVLYDLRREADGHDGLAEGVLLHALLQPQHGHVVVSTRTLNTLKKVSQRLLEFFYMVTDSCQLTSHLG
jgi:hypothetical protein